MQVLGTVWSGWAKELSNKKPKEVFKKWDGVEDKDEEEK